VQNLMIELAEYFGFNFQAQTFPELFLNLFLGFCGVCIIASVLKVLIWIPFNSKKMI